MSLLDRVQKQQGPDPSAVPEGAYVPQAGVTPGTRQSAAATRVRTSFEVQAERIKNRLQARLIENIDEGEDEDREQRAARITDALNAVVAEMGLSLTKPEKQRLLDSVLNDFLGLGPIEALISDPTITEIMVNGPDQIFVEHKGKLTLSTTQFESEEQLRRVIDRIVSTIGRRIDESSPMVDARLKDGSRVNVIIPPLSLNGPILTIRKFSKDPYKINDLIKFGSLTEPMALFVRACVRSRLDMLQAMNTGHDGSLTTIHANSPRDSLNRLETLVLMAGAELPSRAIREQISSAINVIVQQSRLRDGTRKIIAVSEVLGLHGDQVKVQDIFVFKQTGVSEDGYVQGFFTATGIIPKYFDPI